MALKKCPDCGNKISTKARSCPSCGSPVRRKSSAGCGCLFIVAVIGVLTLIWGGGDSKPKKVEQEQESFPYAFIERKTEYDENQNVKEAFVMELFAYSEEFDIENLKSFCAKKK